MQAQNLLVVLPAVSTAKKGSVKHAVFSEAVAVELKEMQLSVPGNYLLLADQVGCAGSLATEACWECMSAAVGVVSTIHTAHA